VLFHGELFDAELLAELFAELFAESFDPELFDADMLFVPSRLVSSSAQPAVNPTALQIIVKNTAFIRMMDT